MIFDRPFVVCLGARYRKALLAGTALASLALLPSAAQAQVWQNGGVDNGNYNESTNWTTNTVPDTAGETATFANVGTTAVTVTLGPIGPQSWTFATNSQSYTVTGQAVNFANGITNNANAGQAISIANNMTGTTISQATASTLTLSGTNSFANTDVTGGTLVNSGNLTSSVSNSATFTNSGTVTGTVFATAGTFGNSGTVAGNVSFGGGTGTNTGTISNTLFVSGGTFSNNAGGSVAGLTTIFGGTVTNNGGTFGAIDNNSGTFTIASGTINGTVANDQTFNANGGTFNSAITNSGTFTIGGVITANVAFTNAGSGDLDVSGADLTGITTFTNNSSSPGAVNVSSGRTLSANTIANNNGIFTNNGTVTAAGGTTNASGAFFISTGTLNGGFTNDGSANFSGTINGAIVNNSSFNAVGATLTGNSTLTNGAAALTLNIATGDFIGITTLTNNSSSVFAVNVNAGRTLGANTIVNNAGTFTNNGTVTTTGGTTNNAGATFVANSATAILNGGLANAGTANMRGAVNGLVSNIGGGVFTVTNTLVGSNTFVNSGTAQLAVSGGDFTGITTLTNNSTNATGVSVTAGRTLAATSMINAAGATINNLGTITTNAMLNDGTITGAYAMAGGTLSGVGNTQNLSISGGTFAPGSGAAGSSMTVTGSMTLTAAATYLVQINPATSSFANVTGTATLGGATVNAAFANGSYVEKKYTILTAGNVSGTFGGTANTNLPSGFQTALSYDGTHAYLDLSLIFVPPPGGLSVNQQNVGNAVVNFFNSNGSIPIVFGGLTPAGLTQIAGETATGSQQTTFDAMNQFMGVMTDPFIAGRGDPVGAGGSPNAFASEESLAEESLAYAANGKARSRKEGDAYAAIYRKAPPMAPSFEQRWSVWAAGFGGSQTTAGNTAVGSNNTRSSLAAVAVGADYRLSPNTLAGFALAGGGTSFSVANGGSGRSDLFQAGAFIRHNVGAAYLSGALAYGWQDITTDRTVTVAGVDRLRAQFNANAWSGRVEGGYRFVGQGVGLTPYAAGQFTTFELPAYAESVISGANTFALSYAGKSVTATRSELGIRSDKSFALQDAILTLRGRAAWAHNFDTDRTALPTFQALPGASFVVNGAAQAREAALVTASAEMKWINGWSIAGTFEGEFSNVTDSYAGKGVVRYAW